MSSEWIRKTEEFLKRKFDSGEYLNAHPEAKTYRLEHTYYENLLSQLRCSTGIMEER